MKITVTLESEPGDAGSTIHGKFTMRSRDFTLSSPGRYMVNGRPCESGEFRLVATWHGEDNSPRFDMIPDAEFHELRVVEPLAGPVRAAIQDIELPTEEPRGML